MSATIVACSPTMDGELDTTSQSFNAATPALPAENAEAAQGTPALGADDQQATAAAPVPQARPGAAPEVTGSAGPTAEAPPDADAPQKPTETAAAEPAQQAETTASAADTTPAAAAPDKPKQQGFLASFFGGGKQPAKQIETKTAFAAPDAVRPVASGSRQAKAEMNADAKQVIENPSPQLSFENIAPVEAKSSRAAARRNQAPAIMTASASSFADDGEGTGLPGVRQSALFEIKRKSGLDDDSDVDIHEDVDDGPIDVASAAGLARLAPNGLLKQRDSVDVACLKPSLVRVLKTIERRFGKKVIVTSGYRSPTYNRSVRGAKNSQHMYCAAADIQVPGVSRWELANFARSMPGRGGVGTYCHTASVHVDVGPERDWNWRCRGRRRT